jgi:SAM-dependent methyltransferase
MTEQFGDKDKWNSRYRVAGDDKSSINSSAPQVSRVLTENSHLLPEEGVALDLACGLGANALFLAKQGLTTHAWDISDVAITALQDAVRSMTLQINSEVRDVILKPPLANSFDTIVVCRFLDRRLTGSLVDALKPGGMIFYQTFSVDKMSGVGPGNPDYLLKPNELLQMFRSLVLRVYREEGLEGNVEQGFRNEVMLVAQKAR